jgi:4-amino-4-deoxy-L-arabinose transferase-like glycosyltransferase
MINALKTNLHILCLILMVAVFILCKIPYLSLPYYWDEAWVYGPALRIMEAQHLSIMPDALPVEYSRGHPLLFHFTGALWLRVFGTSLFSSHAFALTVSIALLFFVFYFCTQVFSKETGLIACFFILLQPIFQAQSVLVLPEIMLALFSLMTVFYFLKEKWFGYVIAGICAVFTKETGIVLFAVVGLWHLTDSFFLQKEKLNFVRFILKSFLLLIPLALFAIFLVIQKKEMDGIFFRIIFIPLFQILLKSLKTS